jgi:hypothetical protein
MLSSYEAAAVAVNAASIGSEYNILLQQYKIVTAVQFEVEPTGPTYTSTGSSNCLHCRLLLPCIAPQWIVLVLGWKVEYL